MESIIAKMDVALKKPTRQQVYPWSMGAKIRQFPYLRRYQTNAFDRNYMRVFPFIVVFGMWYFYKGGQIKRSMAHHEERWDANKIPAKTLASKH